MPITIVSILNLMGPDMMVILLAVLTKRFVWHLTGRWISSSPRTFAQSTTTITEAICVR